MLAQENFKQPQRAPHAPQPHQEEAVRAILRTFKRHSRTHAVMACGTGKTHVCLWVAEKLKAKRIVVFVPSLALINQILHEWLIDTSWKSVSCLAVCSDESVTHGTDIFTMNPEECDFPVTTKAVEIRRFLKQKFEEIQLIFCTYHSSGVLAAAMSSGVKPFDLAVFDEAHKTTGAYDKVFSTALSDKNIPVKKRLFVTATPRHYDIHSRNKSGDPRLVYSMDSEKYYGPRAYTLSFRQAVNLGIIIDYKILVPVIVRENIKSRRKITGKELDEKAVALQIATKNYDISKIITFHSSIDNARLFTHYLDSSKQLPPFHCYHVNSSMPIFKRTEAMDNFKYYPKSLISNARCLTEGTNIPAVDMVAFFNHKRSKIDIVQAIGRVMRKHDNKNVGYVFLPLFIHPLKGENAEEAMHREHYEQIWEVLEALAEQDEDLHQTITNLKIEKGQKRILNFDKLNQFLTILPDVKINKKSQTLLKKSISIAVIDNIGSNWYEKYGRLCAFKELYGHCNVPMQFKLDRILANWIGTQRALYKKKELSEKKINLLNKVGFVWDLDEYRWNEQYQKLIQFKKKFGHCNVSRTDRNNYLLGCWVSSQRKYYEAKTISKAKIQLLNKLEFFWGSSKNAKWDKKYAALVKFKKKYGHCNVPVRFKSDRVLGRWSRTQRSLYKKKQLSEKRINLLDKIGFVWDINESSWNEKYQKLIQFKNKFGHCNVNKHDRNNHSLYRWIKYLRMAYINKKLSKMKIRLLNKLRFNWDLFENNWMNKYYELIKFKEKYGHSNVAHNMKGYVSLSVWVALQRSNFRKEQLTDKRIALLNKIGFVWELRRKYNCVRK